MSRKTPSGTAGRPGLSRAGQTPEKPLFFAPLSLCKGGTVGPSKSYSVPFYCPVHISMIGTTGQRDSFSPHIGARTVPALSPSRHPIAARSPLATPPQHKRTPRMNDNILAPSPRRALVLLSSRPDECEDLDASPSAFALAGTRLVPDPLWAARRFPAEAAACWRPEFRRCV
jgi:hypothetical protein